MTSTLSPAPAGCARDARQRRQRLGQYFTPSAVADLALDLLEAHGRQPETGPSPLRVVDPAAGEGVFLRAAMDRWQGRRLACAGVDLDGTLDFTWAPPESRSGSSATLVHGNGLLDHPEHGITEGSFDLALGNPPYGGDGLAELGRLADSPDPRDPGLEEAWRLARAVLRESTMGRALGPAVELPAHAPPDLGPSLPRLLRRAARIPIELLFVERFVRLLRPGGWMACVLPEGILANARTGHIREWLADQGTVTAIIGLPKVFTRAGTAARTALVVYRKHGAEGSAPRNTLVTGPDMEWRPRDVPGAHSAEGRAEGRTERGAGRSADRGADRGADRSVGRGADQSADRSADRGAGRPDASAYLDGVRAALGAVPLSGDHHVPWTRLQRQRWDPQFWDPRWSDPLQDLEDRFRRVPLGQHIRHITYGPIVTGIFPDAFPGPVPVVSQGQFEESGINLHGCARVARGCVFDPERSRARPRDLLMPRSGAGSLGRNRLAVLDGIEEVNVGCFVDVIRLDGLNPWYAWFFLKTRFGWGQVRRIINGVGVPNISFDEIRGLEVPTVPEAVQQAVEDAWRAEIRPLHEALVLAEARSADASTRDALRGRAHRACRGLVLRLERVLTGEDDPALLAAPAPR